MKQPALYLGVLLMMAGVVLTALGGGVFNQDAFWMVQWQHHAFAMLCHQIPDRSFLIAGQPMAVCSRCIGLYAGFLTGWMLLPLSRIVNFPSFGTYKRLVVISVGCNVLDILGNVLGFWQNTLVTRALLGMILGVSAAGLFTGSFFIRKINIKEANYGAFRKPGA